MKFKSIIYWPNTVSLGTVDNTSEDTHDSFDAAAAVCDMIEQQGFGGEGKIFPIKTLVKPVKHEFLNDSTFEVIEHLERVKIYLFKNKNWTPSTFAWQLSLMINPPAFMLPGEREAKEKCDREFQEAFEKTK